MLIQKRERVFLLSISTSDTELSPVHGRVCQFPKIKYFPVLTHSVLCWFSLGFANSKERLKAKKLQKQKQSYSARKLHYFCTAKEIMDLIQLYLPGHGSLLHACVSLSSPEHCAPPLDGGGLVQVRERSCCPAPQVTLHCAQSPQYPHPPFTAAAKGKKCKVSWAQFRLLAIFKGLYFI